MQNIRYYRFFRWMRRKYIQKKYWFTVNDLRVPEQPEYKWDGVYPTLYHSAPHNYAKKKNERHYDNDGVVLYQYKGENVYNAIQIAQQGLEEYGFYLSDSSDEHRKNLEAPVNWMIANQDSISGEWKLKFDFQHPRIEKELKAPWISALAQGQGISLMCRLFSLTGDDNYLKVAEKAIQPMMREVNEGGVLLRYGENCWLEEYPTTPSSYTLNGFLFAIFGVYDLSMATGNEDYKNLFIQCVKSVERALPLYDSDYLSYYDLCHIMNPLRKPTTNSKYHVIHVILLKTLYSVYPSDTIKFYYTKWDKY